MVSYGDVIGEFWKRIEGRGLDCTQIALMMGLLRFWHKAGFPARCEIRNDEVMSLLSISKPTLTRARERLSASGLISFEEGNGRKQPVYEFRMLEEDYSGTGMPVSFEPVEVLPPQVDNVSRKEVKRPQRIRKTAEEPSLMFKEDKVKEKKVKKEDVMPSQEEVVTICMKKGMTEEEALRFYFYYNAQGWLTSSGQKIKNVDSMVNRWLTTQKKRDETDRRLIQQYRASSEDNIREAQDGIIREMRQSVLRKAEEGSGGIYPILPDDL